MPAVSQQLPQKLPPNLANESAAKAFLDNLLNDAVYRNVADIHFETAEDNVVVRFRLDGLLYDMHTVDFQSAQSVLSRVKILASLDISEYNIPQDGRFLYTYQGQEIDCRVSALPTIQGESLVIRLLNKNRLFSSMESLGMLPQITRDVTQAYQLTQGMLLVAGPTGSGKTTTLYSILNQLNSPKKKLITVEDPVEYSIPGITQVPVNASINVTFGRCVRSFLRQDPDVILVGEIRDRETAQISARAALTGHLVLSTLHTPDSTSAITRLRDLGLELFLITAALEGVLAQRLVRINCSRCRTQYTPDDEIREQFSVTPEISFSRGLGCPHCHQTGFFGRRGIFEYLKLTNNIKNLIARENSNLALFDNAIEQGMITLKDSGLFWAQQGETTLEETLRVI